MFDRIINCETPKETKMLSLLPYFTLPGIRDYYFIFYASFASKSPVWDFPFLLIGNPTTL